MEDMIKLRIKNWRNYQHYTDRNPTWIKLHLSILSSPEWVMLDADGRNLMVATMLIASKTKDGTFEKNESYFQRVAYLKKVDFNPLINMGFLDVVSDASILDQTLATASDSSLLFSNKDSIIIKDSESKNINNYNLGGFEDFWAQYPKQRIGNKQSAFVAWKKTLAAGESAPSVLIAAAMSYASSDEVARGFAKGCAAWLNDERWRNDYSIKTKKETHHVQQFTSAGERQSAALLEGAARATERLKAAEADGAGNDGILGLFIDFQTPSIEHEPSDV